MRLALISDVYSPQRSSGAVQLTDLSVEFARQGHAITVIVATPGLRTPWVIEDLNGVQVLRLRAPATRGKGHVCRAIGELLMPFEMLWNFRKSPLKYTRWEAVIWYSPTIFLGPLVKFLKWQNHCKSYLIIRDIFPEWALDMGLLRRGPVYAFFKVVASYQYSAADVIGVQSLGNKKYFDKWLEKKIGRRVEVLDNWLANRPLKGCRIQISQTALQGRKIFVYAGNMGVAQGIEALLILAASMRENSDVGFVFVGRGSEFERIKRAIKYQGLYNTLLFDEIEPDEIPGLYAQCHVGMVALDQRHRTHNIPGKFLSYMQSGLPVLAKVNPGNDLIKLIETAGVGVACAEEGQEALHTCAENVLRLLGDTKKIQESCGALSSNYYSPESAVKKILTAVAH